MSAIRFVLMNSLRDMSAFATKGGEVGQTDDVMQVDSADVSTARKSQQRMSRAVASSLPPTLSLLRRMMSRPLLAESQISSLLAKMKEADFASLLTNLPQQAVSDDGSASAKTKFNAAQFTRAFHLELSRLSMEVWSDDRFPSVPSHVMYPYLTYLSDVLRSLEGASKAVVPSPPSSRTAAPLASAMAGSRLRQLQQGPDSRTRRIAASMGLMNPSAVLGDAGEDNDEPFEPSEGECFAVLASLTFKSRFP